MANPSIGDLTFNLLRGKPLPGAGFRISDILPAGYDGVELLRVSTNAEPVQVESMVDLTEAETSRIQDTYQALKGTLVTVVDQFSATYTNVAVLDVTNISKHKIGTSAGGITADSDYIVRATWTLQRTTTDNTDT